MGQTSQKVQQKLQQIGYSRLPIKYKLDDNNIFRSEHVVTGLKGLSVLLNPNEVDSYLSHLVFRKQCEQFVKVLFVDIRKQQQNYCKLIIYTEYIPLRLENIFSIHFQNMMKIIYRATLGFQALFQKFGYFTIDSSLIGINEEGFSKCWLNKKYNESHPKPSFSYNKVKNAQASMVQELKEVFKCKVDKETLPYMFNLENTSFQALRNQLISKIGQEFLESKLEMNPEHSSPLKSLQSTIASNFNPSGQHKISSGTQIRFNYQMRESNRSNIKITFNNNKSVEMPRNASTSLQKRQTKINFSYQRNPSLSQSKHLEKSLINQLQNVKEEDRINQRVSRFADNRVS